MAQVSKVAADSVSTLEESVRQHVRYSLAREWEDLSTRDLFEAVALAVRDRMVDRMLDTEERYDQADRKRLYYLSMEFLIGRSLGNNLYNLGLLDQFQETLQAMGVDLEEVREAEEDAALGNGGLGRLAACFLDSLATLGMPGYGYGINYEFGLFRQEISNGYQREKPDSWRAYGTPWLVERTDAACFVPVYGRIEHRVDWDGNYNPLWTNWKLLVGMPYDMPIVGYGAQTLNFLRLFSARASNEFDSPIFNSCAYTTA